MEIGRVYDFGPIVAAILEKDNAVEDFRTLIGSTNLQKVEGIIRARFATSIGENAVHGSDSDENQIEGDFHFAGREQFKKEFLITLPSRKDCASTSAKDVNVDPQQ